MEKILEKLKWDRDKGYFPEDVTLEDLGRDIGAKMDPSDDFDEYLSQMTSLCLMIERKLEKHLGNQRVFIFSEKGRLKVSKKIL